MKYELISISRIFVVAFCLYKVFIAGLNYLNLSAEKAFFGEELINKDERIQTMVDSLHASLQEFVCQTECGNYIIQYEFEGKRYSIEIVDPQYYFRFQKNSNTTQIYITVKGTKIVINDKAKSFFSRLLSGLKATGGAYGSAIFFPNNHAPNYLDCYPKETHTHVFTYNKNTNRIKSIQPDYIFGINRNYILKTKTK